MSPRPGSAFHRALVAAVTAIVFISIPTLVAATETGVPVSSAAQPYIHAMNTGYYHTCAIVGASGVKCWGANGSGQLSDGTVTNRNAPAWVTPSVTDANQISAGWVHTCVLRTGGTVSCWGANNLGQLGTGDFTSRTGPTDVVGLAGPVEVISANDSGNCALLKSGGVQCWGEGPQGVLGDGTIANRATPGFPTGLTSGVVQISGNSYHACVTMSSGAVQCWGKNDNGRLGDGTLVDHFTPAVVSGISSGAVAVTAGKNHTCALMAAGNVKCWGDNANGQLGVGDTTRRTSPVDVTALGNDVEMVAAGGFVTCALMKDTTVKCWGNNANGAVGDGTVVSRTSPVTVTGLTGVRTIAATGGFSGDHACALLTNGQMKCWGQNSNGQIGDGTVAVRTSPVAVVTSATDATALGGVSVVTSTTSTTSTTTTTVEPTTTTSAVPVTIPSPTATAPVVAVATTTTTATKPTRAASGSAASGAGAGTGNTLTTATLHATTVAPMVTTTTLVTAPSIPAIHDGVATMSRNGAEVTITATRKDNALVLSSDSVSFTVRVLDSSGAVSPLETDGSIRVRQGQRISVTAEGMQADSSLEAWLFSTPARLGTIQVDTLRHGSGTFAMPSGAENGTHRLGLFGTDGAGQSIGLAVQLKIGDPVRPAPVGRIVLVTVLVLAVLTALTFPAIVRGRHAAGRG